MVYFGDSFAMMEALEGVDLVYHLISKTVPRTSNRDPVSDIESNLVKTVRLLEQMVKANVKRIIFLTSGVRYTEIPASLRFMNCNCICIINWRKK